MINGNLIPIISCSRLKMVIIFGTVLLIILVALFGGCSSELPASQPSEVTTPSPTLTQTEPSTSQPAPATTTSPEPTMEPLPIVEPATGKLSFSATPEIEELKDVTWISPGKVNIENLYPGATAEYPITIHNGNDEPMEFVVAARQPDNVTEGYEALPSEYLSWVIISTPKLVLEPKQTADVLITISMPGAAHYAGKRAEFWISVIDKSQEDMVRTELAARWLVSTK